MGRDWSELVLLVDQLLDTPPQDRAALIAQLSGGNKTRRAELEHLLAECEREPAFFGRPAAERFAALFDDDVARFPEALAARYRLTEQLERGGMATVYLARDLKHSRDVAVKVVHPVVASALGADLFLREIEIVAQLHHPHIVPLFDSGEADGSLYYVMPYEAGSLRRRMSDGPLSVDEVVLVLRDVCDALAYAHRHGVVHRDIKPDNILLSGRHAMVTDFGVAQAATATIAAKGTGVSLGTPAYMAPEQISGGKHVDHRADIYAVGVVAYELLAGHPPFDDKSTEKILAAHLTAPPPPLTDYRSDLPSPLTDLVTKCLEKDPDDRWQTADDLVEQLENMNRGSDSATTLSSTRRMFVRASLLATAAIAAAVIGMVVWQRKSVSGISWRDRWANARIERVTDFPGSEVDAAISPDGQSVAFLSDRDSVFDAFVTRVGSGQFLNLTNGRFPQLLNEDVRNIGFSPDGAHVWIRIADINSPASVSIMPTSGGAIQPFLKTAVMAAWSPDGSKLAYHETTTGDPIYVADANGRNPRLIFISEPGLHSHYVAWSPDGRFLYFSHGVPPDEMDIWRIPSNGRGTPERITSHNSRVGYPVLLDDRTLLYTATADDGTGPWLYTMDVDARDRVAHRVSRGVEHYISIAASTEVPGAPRRLVASVSNPSVQLWTAPITSGVASERVVTPMALPTARSAGPRFAPDASLYYLAARGGGDGLWRLSGAHAKEIWQTNEGAVVGAAAVSPDGRQVCFPVGRRGHATLYCARADGSAAHPIAPTLDVRGAASWSPDGKWIAIGAVVGSGVRVFKVSVAGGTPVRLVDSVSSNPVWSPDGSFIVYSGTSRARTAPLKAVTPEGQAYPLPALLVDRVGDSYRFLHHGKQLVVKLGGFRRQDFWLFDVTTGEKRRLTALKPGASLQRFDVSPDDKRILFERGRENSDVVLIELPPA